MNIIMAIENKCYKTTLTPFCVLYIQYLRNISLNSFKCNAVMMWANGNIFMGKGISSLQLPQKLDLLMKQDFSPIMNEEFAQLWEDAYKAKKACHEITSEYFKVNMNFVNTEIPI